MQRFQVTYTIFTFLAVTGIGKVALLSLLSTQFIIFGLEIYATGFRSWLHESMRHSYVGYIRRYGRREWALFATVFIFVFAAFSIMWKGV